MVVFGSIALFSQCMPAGRHSDNTPDSRRVRLYSDNTPDSRRDYREVRTCAGSPTALVCTASWLVVERGNFYACS